MKIICLILMLLGCDYQLNAQAYTATHNTSVQVSKISNITVTSTNSVSIPNSVDYTVGTSFNNFWTVQVDANSSWQVIINAQASTFTASNGQSVPIGILSYRKNGLTNWTTLTTSSTTPVASGSIGDNTVSGNTFGVDLRVIPSLNYEPGTYTLNIIFTSTAQ